MVLVHVVDGRLEPGMKVRLMASGGTHEVEQLGVFTPKPLRVDSLSAGEVGFVIAGIKRVADVAIGDTLTDERRPAKEPLPGFKEIKPMVFAGLYPVDADQYAELRDALEKLRLNDSSFFYEPETSAALGFGFRCGFLGLLHMEIVQERLEREFNLELLITAPSVRYRVLQTDGQAVEIDSPARLPDPGRIESIEEPVITATILTGDEFVGGILKLCQDKRGIQKGIHYITPTRVMIQYELPLAEILLDFYDKLKSASRGYASLDYELTGHWVSPLVKLDVLVNGDPVDALSLIVHRDTAYPRGKALVEKMRKLIPRQMFEVAIQAAIGSRVIARETVKPAAQERHRQVLRRRHHAQAQAPREAEGRQEADEAGRHRGHPAGGLPGRAARRRLGARTPASHPVRTAQLPAAAAPIRMSGFPDKQGGVRPRRLRWVFWTKSSSRRRAVGRRASAGRRPGVSARSPIS